MSLTIQFNCTDGEFSLECSAVFQTLTCKLYFQLAQLPTPIHQWNLQGIPDGYQIYIKRDDLTGSTLTGNKVNTPLADPGRGGGGGGGFRGFEPPLEK